MESRSPHRGLPPPNDGVSAVMESFPQFPEDFANDERVAYDKLEGKWILETENDLSFEWNDRMMKWIPALDDDLIKTQQQAYDIGEENAASQGQNDSVKPGKKRKANDNGAPSAKGKKARETEQKEKPNCAIYVTGIPSTATIDDVKILFTQKAGIIAESDNGTGPRIKLYTDEKGNRKGDGMIVFFRPESVQMAINLLDGVEFDFDVEEKMTVQAAEKSYKKNKGHAPESAKDKKKAMKSVQKQNARLTEWDDDDPSAVPATSSRFDRVVVLKHMFTPQELEEDPTAILDIPQDIRDECSKFGDVSNVTIFDKEEAGVVTVRFGNAQAADACVRALHGRMFGGQAVVATIATGEEKFKKSKKHAVTEENDEKEETRRLDQFAEWLEHEKE